MNNKYDEFIRKKLQENEYSIPDSFNKKFEETVAKIADTTTDQNEKSHNEIKRSIYNFSRLSTNKLARIAILAAALVVGSVSTYAAVNMYQQRMEAIPEKMAEKYYDDVQQNKFISADAFSRQLSESEKGLMINLRNQYEEQGLFPQNEIKQFENSAEVVDGELCFVSEESKYYLPERTLSEEEILEIIDLQEKRDYSVRLKNKDEKKEENQESDNTDIFMAADLQKQSAEVVAALFALEENELESISSKKSDDSMKYIIKGEDALYSVDYYNDNTPYRVRCEKDNVPAHDMGIKLEKVNIKTISKKMKKKTEIFTNKNIDAQEAYSMINENDELAYGTVSIFYQMADGSGCVAVYSSAYKDLCEIYTVKDAGVFKDIIRQKKENAKKSGNKYQLLW